MRLASIFIFITESTSANNLTPKGGGLGKNNITEVENFRDDLA